jgi:uncharacterized SAM-binding protein YcdF (DUF218 family)
MMLASKILTTLILPPGCFVIVLLIIVLFVPRRFKAFPAFVMMFLYAFSIQPVSDFFMKPLENAYPPLSKEFSKSWPDAIVVLGGGTVIGSPETEEGHDALASDALNRAVYAYTLRGLFNAPIVFSGGKVFDYNQESEASAAGKLLETLGLPSRRFVAEDQSRTTWENARETAKMGYKKVILVTSAYHMKRSVYCFEQNGMTVATAPTDYKTDRGRKYDVISFMPSMNSFRNTYLAFHEYVGLLYYIIAKK